MMTEKEASERWCPMVRVVIGPDTESWQENMFDNRGDVVTVNGLRCIGSRCMAWRWHYEPGLPVSAVPGMSNGPIVEGAPIQTDRGYCGLAGKNG